MANFDIDKKFAFAPILQYCNKIKRKAIIYHSAGLFVHTVFGKMLLSNILCVSMFA